MKDDISFTPARWELKDRCRRNTWQNHQLPFPHNQCQYWWRSVRVGWRLILYHGHKKGRSESVFTGCVNNKKIPYLSAGWLWAWSLGQLCNREYIGYYHWWLVGISVRYLSLMLKDYYELFTRAPGSRTPLLKKKIKTSSSQDPMWTFEGGVLAPQLPDNYTGTGKPLHFSAHSPPDWATTSHEEDMQMFRGGLNQSSGLKGDENGGRWTENWN